jgi:hypothetical protein
MRRPELRARPEYSIVVPAFNEAELLDELDVRSALARGFDVVYGVRRERPGERRFKRVTAAASTACASA